MKKLVFIFCGCLSMAVFLLSGCVTVEPQEEIATYYSMVYDIGYDAFQPIAENFIESGDSVLIVNTGQGFRSLGFRFKYESEEFDLKKYLADHPFFIEYLESGMIRSILKNRGKGYERLYLPDYMTDYEELLRENEYIFNTSLLNYDRWEDIKEDFNVNKILIYTVNKVVDEESKYIGAQLSLKFIDVDGGGRILWESTENVLSSDFPNTKLVSLDKPYIEISKDAMSAFYNGLKQALDYEGLRLPIDALLVKIDDIPILGNYPITAEDFIVEQTLGSQLGRLKGINILEKLYKRRYKKYWQLTNAVFYINPLQGGEYAEFGNYYGSKYMLGYRVLWNAQTGKIDIDDSGVVGLNEKILGVYIKLIDVEDSGRIIYGSFLPFASKNALQKNLLYRSYLEATSLEKVLDTISELGVISDEEKVVLINKRMEVLKNYLINSKSSYEAIYNLFATKNSKDILAKYDKIYSLLDISSRKAIKGDIYYAIAAYLLNMWIEDGLISILTAAGYGVNEKLESIYSRYLLAKKYGTNGDNIFLSPLLLREWGSNIKNFYDVDKVIYYIALEKAVADENFITPSKVISGAGAAEMSQYYPLLSYKLNKFLFSVLDVQTGDYVFNRNFDLEKGGDE